MHGTRNPIDGTAPDPALPPPSRHSLWRWSTTRRALAGGGVLAAALSLGTGAAGAATSKASHTGSPPARHGQPPAGRGQPTAAGKIAALATDTITVQTRTGTSQTVTYSSATTFRTTSGTASASALKVGEFVAVQGSRAADGHVTAKTVMISTSPPARRPGTGPGSGGPPGGAPPPSA